MKSPKQCLICSGARAEDIELIVHHKNIAAGWNVRVCRSCWRVLEAMLDDASPGRQLSLTDSYASRNEIDWFW
jgi:hypothetical protein